MDTSTLTEYERDYLKTILNHDKMLVNIVQKLLAEHITMSHQALLALSTELSLEEFKINHVAIKYDIRRMQYIQRFIDDMVGGKKKEEAV